MNKGLIEQEGSPEDVYRRPESRFVASFLGQSNLLPGRIAAIENGIADLTLSNGQTIKAAAPVSASAGAEATGVVRAQKIMVTPKGATPVAGKIVSVSYLGGTAAYFIDMNGIRLQSISTIEDRVWKEGEDISIAINPADCQLLDENGRRLR
jgi:ABC-type Fe3+/spermidine/putrescine transport system ATPase subunit